MSRIMTFVVTRVAALSTAYPRLPNTPAQEHVARDDGQNNQVNGHIDMHVNREGEGDAVAAATGHGTTAG